MRALPACLLLLVTTLLGACATGPAWMGAGRSADQSRSDLSSCRSDADGRMKPTEYVPPGRELDSSNTSQMVAQYGVTHHYDSIVTDCMQSKGYHPSN